MKISVLKSRFSLGFQRAALIEPDEHFSAKIAGYADDIGLTDVNICASVEAFWQLGPERYDLIIIDWNIRGKTSALSLFNRLRHDPRYSTVPILVISGFIDRNDFRILEEFPFTRLVEKPFTAGVFIEAVQSLQDEKDWVRAHEKSMRRLLIGPQAVEVPRAKKLQNMLQRAPYPAPMLLMFGRYLSREKRWDEAHDLFQSVVKANPLNVLALNELGKVLHASGRHKEALKVLTAADTLSPDNLRRICQLGELQMHEWQLQDAQKNFERVLTVDPQWNRARQGRELTLNVFQFMQQNSDSSVFPASFASLMNTMGISKVHNGHLDEGIQHYESALMFIRDIDTRAKVMFNMGLGYLRFRLGDKALLWFMRSAKFGGKSFPKAHPYIKELTEKLVWTEQGLKILGQETVEVDDGDHGEPSPHERTPDSHRPISMADIQPVSVEWDMPTGGTVLELEDFDTDALLSGIAEEGFC